MSSSAIVALFRTSFVSTGIIALIGLSAANARSQSAQLPSSQTAPPAATAPAQSGPGATTTGASTVLKIPTTTVLPEPLTATIQPVPSTTAVSPNSAAPAGIGATVTNVASQSQTSGVDSLSPVQRITYQRAALAFTSFCHDWERLLHEREVDNLEHLSWREDSGLEIATYTGYGKVESCECKESKEGLPIGKIRYMEINYSIAGKTIDEARRAAPKLTHEISTLEIFSWDKDKWFY
jgi:hypothetical protein